MRKINNKGFTLIELIATIVLLVIVMGIGTYSITAIIKNSKEKDYKLLIKNIKDASELYYQECKYGGIEEDIINGCDKLNEVSLGNLVRFGYLTGNKKICEEDSTCTYTLVNPVTGESIANCEITITYNSGVIVEANESENDSCPTSY